DNLSPRFDSSPYRICDRVPQGMIRLGIRVTPPNAVININREVSFILDEFWCPNRFWSRLTHDPLIPIP
ncbi:MAG: hypothetical protein ABI876_14515, partial [Bacteroidota bacterium]